MSVMHEALGLGETIPGYADRSERAKAALAKPQAQQTTKETPSAYGDRPVLRLNAHWAVSDDGALQWFLLRAGGGTWRPRRFHVDRDALLRSVRELCGPVDPAAVETIGAWPAMYRPDFAAAR